MRILSRKKISENEKQSFYFTGPINTSHGVGILCKHIRSLWLICLTRDNIKKRKIQFPNRCYMCKKEAETPRHLLLHCEVARIMEHVLLSLWHQLDHTPHSQLRMHMRVGSCGKLTKPSRRSGLWYLLVFFWCIWFERNKKCFDRKSTASGILKSRCIANLFSWSNLYPAANAEQLQEFINSLVLA